MQNLFQFLNPKKAFLLNTEGLDKNLNIINIGEPGYIYIYIYIYIWIHSINFTMTVYKYKREKRDISYNQITINLT